METETSHTSIREHISLLMQAASNVVSKTISLAALEGRLAGKSLLSIFVFLLIGSFLILAAWIILLVAAALWLTSLDISLTSALAIIAISNLLLLIPIGLQIKRSFQRLFFPATRRQLNASNVQII